MEMLIPEGYRVVAPINESTLKFIKVVECMLLGCDSTQYGNNRPHSELQKVEVDLSGAGVVHNPRRHIPVIECIIKVADVVKSINKAGMDGFTGEIHWATDAEHASREAGVDCSAGDPYCLNTIPPVFWYVMEKVDG
ncbi:hypothetical protein MYOV003v1_p0035 [Vibrio phage 207E48.1]|nr:hypothetical protein MYOV003v1_p0035 [Vibrio phage 207E48.1]